MKVAVFSIGSLNVSFKINAEIPFIDHCYGYWLYALLRCILTQTTIR